MPGPAHAFDKQSEGKVSEAVNAGLQHFLDLADLFEHIEKQIQLGSPVFKKRGFKTF
jgi:hypothetical protein